MQIQWGDVVANLIFIALVVGVIVYVIRGFWKRLDNLRARPTQGLTETGQTENPTTQSPSTGNPLPQPKTRVFLCYRRADSPDATGRIYDRLVAAFGSDAVFKDVDDIPLGVDFRSHVQVALSQAKVFLAVIGPRWADLSADGKQRLSAPGDHVRHEIDFALQNSLHLIPVLVGGGRMPTERELPEDMRLLVYRNAVQIRADPDFQNDIDRLVKGIRAFLEQRAP